MTADGLKRLVRLVGTTLTRPDDDWTPTLFLGGMSITVAALKIDGPQAKATLPTTLKELFHQHKPIWAGLIWMRYVVTVRNDAPLGDLSVEMLGAFGASSHPDRIEQVEVRFCRRGGKEEIWHAEVRRFPDRPPQLGEWKPAAGREEGGRMARLLERAFA